MEARARFTSNGRVQPVPVLDARIGGPAERFAGRLRGRHPAAVFFAAIFGGLVALNVFALALGLVVTDVLLHAGGVARTDNSAVRSLVTERTPFLTGTSEVGVPVPPPQSAPAPEPPPEPAPEPAQQGS